MNPLRTQPFLPLYDFDALAAEPEYTPPPAPKSFLEQLMANRVFIDPKKYGYIIVRGPK